MRICLFDNDQIVTKTLEGFLSDLGHEVICIKSAYELLDSLEREEQPVDLIIGDFSLPKDNVVALIREVHHRYPNIAIVITTTQGPILSTSEAISYGVYGYLRKTIRLAELELLLTRLSESRTKSN